MQASKQTNKKENKQTNIPQFDKQRATPEQLCFQILKYERQE
jgi:hypothetical protein